MNMNELIKKPKGGAFAMNDIPLIKKALLHYLKSLDKESDEVITIGMLLHRLNRIS